MSYKDFTTHYNIERRKVMENTRFNKKDFFIGETVKIKNSKITKKGIVKKIGNKYIDLTVDNKNMTFTLDYGQELGNTGIHGFRIAKTEKELLDQQERENLLLKFRKFDYLTIQSLTTSQLRQILAIIENKGV